MGISVRIESLLTSLVLSSDWLFNVTIFHIALLFVVGMRFLFLFRGYRSWITYAVRVFAGWGSLTLSLMTLYLLAKVSSFTNATSLFGIGSLVSSATGLFVGIVVSYLVGRKFEPWLIVYLKGYTRKAGLPETLTDIRQVRNELEDSIDVNSESEFAAAIENNEMFLGTDMESNAVSLDRSTWKSSHVQIMGPPGTGKGIQAGVTLTQSLQYGDAVFVFDPKQDEWAPSVFRAACERAGVPFHYVDLSQPIAQINPLLNSSAQEIAEMLYAGLALGRRGSDADFYRLDDRKAARFAATMVGDESLSMAEMSSRAKIQIDSDLITGAKAFFTAIDEVAELPCVQTREGIDLSAPLSEGGCIYIVGSMRNEPIVILQKMLFVRIVQLIERTRNRERHCSVFLDEFKYLLSAAAVNALGSIRDKGCNILLAHQSLGDFANCGSDLSESAVRSTVLDTTPIKWLYRSSDKDTASWISDQSGQILVSTQRFESARNLELSEILSESRMIGETTRNQFDVNTVMSLPKGCAICIGAGIPKLVMASTIAVDKVECLPVPAIWQKDPGIDLQARIPEEQAEEWDDYLSVKPLFSREPEDRVLRFLYEETWTHKDIINLLLYDVSTRRIRDILERLRKGKFISKHELGPVLGSQFWGISQKGIDRIHLKEEFIANRPVFYKGLIAPNYILHRLDIHLLRLKAERNGWRGWKTGTRAGPSITDEMYPDAIAVRPDNVRVAIEIERTVKSKIRYEGILVGHLNARRLRKWDEIYYLSPDRPIADRLRKIFSEITKVTFRGMDVEITDEHRLPFRFFSYDDSWAEAY